jgi:hypothetical protein
MKKALLSIAILLCIHHSYAQNDYPCWSLEISIGRFAKTTGLFDPEYYFNSFSYLNGFNVNYRRSERLHYFAGCRKFSARIDNGTGYTVEDNAVDGLELRTGLLFTPRSQRRLHLGYGLELFGESARMRGNYRVDYPPEYEINHRKYFAGIAPSLQLNMRLSKRILLFADTRYRIGRAYRKALDPTQSEKPLFHERNYWMRVWEPLNAVGVRVVLYT